MTALSICLERLIPRRHERTIGFTLPKVTTPKDAASALATIMQAVGAGDITLSEGKALASLVEVAVKGLEAVDLEKRISAWRTSMGKTSENRIRKQRATGLRLTAR